MNIVHKLAFDLERKVLFKAFRSWPLIVVVAFFFRLSQVTSRRTWGVNEIFIPVGGRNGAIEVNKLLEDCSSGQRGAAMIIMPNNSKHLNLIKGWYSVI